ncbi:hypothetical protein C8D88_12374 [Lentzea atacamensis]|uniref:Uncharacterized protein n=1 Tax=Lentzea atacamensis TaxID=531938 RepID=A0A316HKZ3_9PSEU|nr:hypothetical protein [Lentzea atacamensis]PWK80710.1 hypothetical protein C8D88_12374 [Lentzea atacamensis]
MKELLSAVMPDLAPVQDRHLQVLKRTREIRRRRTVLGAAVMILLALGAVSLPQLVPLGEPTEPFASVGGSPGPCPRTQPQPGRGTGGLLASDGATAATLCTYNRGEPIGSEREFEARGTVREDVDSIVDALNALPVPKANDSCFMAKRPEYLLVLDYPDRSATVVVEIHMGCGYASNGDAVRSGEITDPLDAFGEAYRAHGGEIAPPPWKW